MEDIFFMCLNLNAGCQIVEQVYRMLKQIFGFEKPTYNNTSEESDTC